MDFHIHINRSEGGPFMSAAEALRYASLCGCRAVGLIVRCDGSALDGLDRLAAHIRTLSLYANVEAFTGVELAHVPPALLPAAVNDARQAGAELVLVHGETLADQVEEGTNLAAVEAGADVLAHPGLIDAQTAAYAAEKGVALELSACPRHGLTNGHVVAMAERFGCALLPGSDANSPRDLLSAPRWKQICLGAGMNDAMRDVISNSSIQLVKKLMTCQKKRNI